MVELGSLRDIHVYTDGGCHGNPGPGGWAFVVHADGEVFRQKGAERDTTNNRMELKAVISALEYVDSNFNLDGVAVHIHTDSQYVQRGMNEWLARWLRNGFKTAAKKPVKNRELWLELNDLAEKHTVRWHWVRGHAGHEFNEECDALVQDAIRELT